MADPLETTSTEDTVTETGQPWDRSSVLNASPWDLLMNPNKVFGEAIAYYFGRPYDFWKLMRTMKKLNTGKKVNKEDLVDMIEMGAYYMRHHQGWTHAASNLEFYLVAGQSSAAQITDSDQNRVPVKYMDGPSVFGGYVRVIEFLCDFDYYAKLRTGIESRLKSIPEAYFPSEGSSVTSQSGGQIPVPPVAAAIWQQGHRGMLYIEDTIQLGNSDDDLYNALGTAAFIVEADVETAPLQDGTGWQVTIHRYRVWGWDNYDWHDGLNVVIPMNLLAEIGADYADTLAAILRKKGYDPSWLESMKIEDSWLRDLEGETIHHSNGRTYYPKSYKVLITPWDVDLGASPCHQEASFVVRRS